LGRKVIPPDHVTLPYSLAQTLQDATAPVGGVNGETVRRDMAAARASLRTDPDGLRRIGDALSSLIDTLDRQSTDVSRALTVLDEYVTTVNASRSVLGKLVRRVGLLETVGLNKRAEIKETLKVLGELLARLAGFVPSYEHVLQPIVDKLGESIPALQQLGIRFDGILRSITDIGNRLQRMAGGPVAASSVCVPVPGRAC
jgi:phospholipid/cholesterol/gamma-HCH transport system substrate-binding protein